MTGRQDAIGQGPRGVALAEGRHWVSAFNFRPEVTGTFDCPSLLGLIDSTIRKVIYTAGVRPAVSDILKICAILDQLGIRDESLNLWWWGESEPDRTEYEVMKAVARGGFGFRINVFSDTLVGDGRSAMPLMPRTFDMLAEAGVPVANAGLLQAADYDGEMRQVEQLAEMSDYARELGLAWTATVANCGRRDFDSMMRVCNAAIAAGADRLDLMDSTSALSPEAMKLFIRTFRSRLVRPVPITMHTHDDFGMATAGTIAAVTAGASPDVALNGVSYRSGFAALEEVVLALDVLYGVDTGIRLDRLQSASERLAEIMGFPVHPLKPVVGAHQFLRDSPGEIARMLQAGIDTFPQSGCSIDPSLVGSRMRWVWGKQGNDALVRSLAATRGVTLADADVKAVRGELDDRLAQLDRYPKWLSSEEVEAAIRRIGSAERKVIAAGAAGQVG